LIAFIASQFEFRCHRALAAIGLGIGNAYHQGSKAALGTQGTLNAVAAGILLYNAIADLIIPGKLCSKANRSSCRKQHTAPDKAPKFRQERALSRGRISAS
jgi:hypothetical protein